MKKGKNIQNYVFTLSTKSRDRFREVQEKVRQAGFQEVTAEPELLMLYGSIESDKAAEAEKELKTEFGNGLEVRPELTYELPPSDSPIQ